MNENTQTQQGLGCLQREEGSGEVKAKLFKEIKAIREGHASGGYVNTDLLKAAEAKLYPILARELEEAKQTHGYSPDPKFKHAAIRLLELAVNGLAYKPTLVAVP